MKNVFLYNDVFSHALAGFAFFCVIGLGAYFRFHSIDTLPCGLAPDEANTAYMAVHAAPAFVYNNPFNESEGFFISFVHLTTFVVDAGYRQVFFASALLGMLMIACLYFAACKHFGFRVALFTTFLFAISPWHIALSQSGTWTGTTPFFLSLVLLCLPKTNGYVEKWRYVAYGFLGFVWALGFYGYLTYRVTILIVAIYVVMYLVRRRALPSILQERLKGELFSFTSLMLGFFIGITPFVMGHLLYPGTAMSRSLQVFRESFPDGRIFSFLSQNVLAIIRGYFVEGSHDWHQNLNSQPFIPFGASPFFFGGLIMAINKSVKYVRGLSVSYIFLLLCLSLLIGIAPGLLSDAAPHGARLNVTMIPLFIFISVGVVRVFEFIFSHRKWLSLVAFTVFCICTFAYGTIATNKVVERRKMDQSYAKDYFCDMYDVRTYLYSRIATDANELSQYAHIYILGTWYETASIEYYFRSVPQVHAKMVALAIEEMDSSVLEPNSIIIIPAYTQIGHVRKNVWIRESGSENQAPLETILSKHPGLKQFYAHTNSNNVWFPDNISFMIYKIPSI